MTLSTSVRFAPDDVWSTGRTTSKDYAPQRGSEVPQRKRLAMGVKLDGQSNPEVARGDAKINRGKQTD